MSAVSTLPALIGEIGTSLGRSPKATRMRALADLVDLLFALAERVPGDVVEQLDDVLVRCVPLADLKARVAAAERLGPWARAPRGILQTLASDDAIVVAWPVLTRSAALDDQALMAVAAEKSPDHRLAICTRSRLSPMVTDFLVSFPERAIGHAIAGNVGAQLSAVSASTLVDRSRDDETLQDLMGLRVDLSPPMAAALLGIVRDGVSRTIVSRLPAASLAKPIVILPDELELRGLALEKRAGEVEILFSRVTGLARSASRRLLTDPANDFLVIVCKARGWSWPTVRALLALRDPALVERHQFHAAEATFDAVATATAERVLRFLLRSGTKRQTRSTVR